jgi:hypothetical protein
VEPAEVERDLSHFWWRTTEQPIGNRDEIGDRKV